MKLAYRRTYLAFAIIAAFIFHAVCRLWISWYILVIVIALPALSAALSLLSVFRAKPVIYMNGKLGHKGKEYIICRCRCGGSFIRYPPRCILEITLRYLASEHSADYQVMLFAGEPEYIKINTAHCTVVRVECTKAYASDYLGIARFRLKKPEALESVILPAAKLDDRRIEKTICVESEKPDPLSAHRSRELYELREYREGDTLRDIHWKMTAKAGRVIVREFEKTDMEKTAVTLDLQQGLADNDEIMELAMGVSKELLLEGRSHSMLWLDESDRLRRADVHDDRTQTAAFAEMLNSRPSESGSSTADTEPEGFDIRLHITSKGADGR